MADGVTVEGGAELAATLHRASGQLEDMERPAERAGTLVATKGRVEAPRLTGALAGSITSETEHGTASVMSALPYAARTHWGYARYGQRAQPFLSDPLAANQNVILGYFEDEADRILHTVKGA